MAKVDFPTLAHDLLAQIGGKENVRSFSHCATRLRLQLKDEDKADVAAVEKLPGVITVVRAGGQFQVVIGNDVPLLHQELEKIAAPGEDAGSSEEKGSLFNRFIQLISSIFQPILWTLAGAGLLKAFLALFGTLGVLDPETSGTYAILNAASDGLFHLLPLFLAVTAAKRFRTNQFTSMAIAAALVYPDIVALSEAEGAASTFLGIPVVGFLGIPVLMMSYVSSVIPIVVAVWLQSYLERFLLRILPGVIRNFTTPLVVLTVMVPLVFLTVGPVTSLLSQGISGGVSSLFDVAPWLAGAILGGFWQVFVMFGLHWGFIPVMLSELFVSPGYSLLAGPIVPAVLAQGGAMLAVMLRSRSAKRRQVAGPAALSGILAGITEPGIYGVNLPLKTPFYFGIVGGVIGGAVAAIGGAASDAFAVPSLLSLPVYLNESNSFALLLVGSAIGLAIGFLLTFFFGPREQPDEVAEAAGEPTVPAPDEAVPAPLPTTAAADAPAGGSATATATAVKVDVVSPMNGRLVQLADVPDAVFSSGAMGAGIAVDPTDGIVTSPISGTVMVTMDSGHAYGIRSDDGVEVLVHIGIDTVNMKGEGFTPKVAQGDRVEVGQEIAQVDLDAVAAAGHPAMTVMIVTNTADHAEVVPAQEETVASGATALTIIR